MPLDDSTVERRTFFSDPALDDELPAVNETFWSALIAHIERDHVQAPAAILDIGCHTGGLLQQLSRRFRDAALIGIEPLAAARAAAAQRLRDAARSVTLLDPADWARVPAAGIDLITSHETLYLEADLPRFMGHIRSALSTAGAAYVVLGCHAENPLWQQWKPQMIAAGHRVYDHAPLAIMEAAASAGLLPSVQPLRRSGWVTYDPLRAEFRYPDVHTMFDHHYRHKLIFRLRIADDRTSAARD
jgi:cyclopropane fatty-acyl-phospholipid synthase-like methyltransferase